MPNINQKKGDNLKVPRELYHAFQGLGLNQRVIWDFFEALAHKTKTTSTVTATATITDPTYTVKSTDGVLFIDASSHDVVVSLRAASNYKGRIFSFKRIDSSNNTVTIDPDESETIDDELTMNLYPYESIDLQSDSANWWII